MPPSCHPHPKVSFVPHLRYILYAISSTCLWLICLRSQCSSNFAKLWYVLLPFFRCLSNEKTYALVGRICVLFALVLIPKSILYFPLLLACSCLTISIKLSVSLCPHPLFPLPSGFLWLLFIWSICYQCRTFSGERAHFCLSFRMLNRTWCWERGIPFLGIS